MFKIFMFPHLQFTPSCCCKVSLIWWAPGVTESLQFQYKGSWWWGSKKLNVEWKNQLPPASCLLAPEQHLLLGGVCLLCWKRMFVNRSQGDRVCFCCHCLVRLQLLVFNGFMVCGQYFSRLEWTENWLWML